MKRRQALAALLSLFLLTNGCAQHRDTATVAGKGHKFMQKRVLIATTSHSTKGESGQPTGAYLPEIAHPYEKFRRAGLQVEFASVQGGKVPLDGVADADELSLAFLRDHEAELNRSLAAEAVEAGRYDAIFFAGGHGAMWDLPDNEAFARASARIYEEGGVVSAVCHGPAALVNIRLPDGRYLVQGKIVSAFTNEEEAAVKLETVVPFLLADKLVERGARHEAAPVWQEKVVVSERLVTGQNPASASGVAQAVVRLLEQLARDPAVERASAVGG
jgi:putative intracellular protease/amidase